MPKPILTASRRKLHRHAARYRLLDIHLRVAEGGKRAKNLARDRRIVRRQRRLQLVGVDHDVIDQHTGYANVMRLQRAVLDHALDLGNHDAAIVVRGERLFQSAEIGAFVLVGEVAALVGGRRADDRNVRHDRAEIEPFVAVELLDRHDGVASRRVHGAALMPGIGESVEPNLGRHAGAFRGRLAVHIEQDAGGHVVGGDRIVADHLPDLGRLRG